MSTKVQYTPEQKAAYYKQKFLQERKKKSKPVIKGRGSYRQSYFKAPVPRFVKGKGAYTSGIGKKIGSTLGGGLGDLAEQGIMKLLGMGSYDVKQNSIWKSLKGNDPPHVVNREMDLGTTCIRHREYLCDIFSSSVAGQFQLQTFNINPGDPNTFPWLSAVATQFEQWRPLGMLFEFKTTSSDALNSTNTALGEVILVTEYDSHSAPFVNKAQMLNHNFCTSGKPSLSMMHPVECAPRFNVLSQYFIRSGQVPSNADSRFYDLGNFSIATAGLQGTSVRLGELWVTYEIELSKPQASNIIGEQILTDHFNLGTVSAAAPLGTSSTATSSNSLGGSINSTGLSYLFNPLTQSGAYLVVYQALGTAAAIVAPGLTATNCTLQNVWFSGTSINDDTAGGNLNARLIQCFVVIVAGQNASIAWGAAGTLPTNVTGGDLYVTQIDYDVIDVEN